MLLRVMTFMSQLPRSRLPTSRPSGRRRRRGERGEEGRGERGEGRGERERLGCGRTISTVNKSNTNSAS